MSIEPKQQKNSLGFSFLEILIVILVLGLVALAGLWVVAHQNKTKTEEKVAQNAKQTTNDTSDWKETTNTTYGYKYKYPSIPKCISQITESEVGSELYNLGERINNAGVSCPVSGRSGSVSVIGFGVDLSGSSGDVGENYDEPVQMKDNNYYQLETKVAITKNSVTGTRWHYKSTDNRSEDIIFYYFNNEKYSYFFQINPNGLKVDDFNISNVGEEIFQTFEFI